MALQLSLRRSSSLIHGASSFTSTKLFSTFRSGNSVPPSSSFVTAFHHHHGAAASAAVVPQQLTKRWATTTPMDLGDVIGIDLGTTNSCVCVMVRFCFKY